MAPKWEKSIPPLTGSFVAGLGILLFGYGAWGTGASWYHVAGGLGLSLVTGAAVWLFLKRRWWPWLVLLTSGHLIGLTSALGLFVGPAVLDEYRVALLTTVIFTVLGLMIGMIAQFISLVHHLLCRALRSCPPDFPEAGGNPPDRDGAAGGAAT
ncbi:hypothetical protein AMJ57_03175 [Parcubacteria bacterium SG8_24]|nr:MAG: hypothetical protein AMJ57_03175 [Parcubacteria bacterium SG8_24]